MAWPTLLKGGQMRSERTWLEIPLDGLQLVMPVLSGYQFLTGMKFHVQSAKLLRVNWQSFTALSCVGMQAIHSEGLESKLNGSTHLPHLSICIRLPELVMFEGWYCSLVGLVILNHPIRRVATATQRACGAICLGRNTSRNSCLGAYIIIYIYIHILCIYGISTPGI
jgi:hypothetical protein